MAKEIVNPNQCMVLFGFNTGQWWVYDDEHDWFIDPPKEILDFMKSRPDYISSEENADYLMKLVLQNPTWLQDSDYWYDGEI